MLRRLARRLATPAALLAMAGAAASPLWLTASWPLTHEGMRYPVLVDLFGRAIAEGVVYPRFLPDLYGGYGYPTFCFYQPGFFWVAVLFAQLPVPLHDALKLALLALLWLGAGGAFRLGAALANRRYGWFAAALFLLTPYLYVDITVRGDLSEAMGVLLGPWVLACALDLERRLAHGAAPAPAMAGLALATTALVLAHPAPALALLPAVATLVLALAWRRPHGTALVARAAASLVFGVALAAPYWAALLALRGEVGFDRLVGGFYAPEAHGAAPWQLVSRVWGFGGSNADTDADDMSFQLGAAHLLLGLVGAWAGRRSRAVVAAAALWLVLAFLVLDSAIPLWRHAGPLRFLQFPWRLLAATATLQVAAAMGLAAWTRRLPPRAEAALLAGLAIAALGWHADQFSIGGATGDPEAILRNYHALTKRATFQHFAHRSEFTPKAARVRPVLPRDPDAPPVVLEGPGEVAPLPGSRPQRVRVRIDALRETRARVEQLYLPGWEIRLDGEVLAPERLEASLSPEGFPRVAIGAGEHRLEAAYGGPPGAAGRALGMLAASLPFAWLLRRPRAASPSAAAPGHSTT